MSTSPSSPFPRRLPDKPRRVRRGLKLNVRPDRLGTHRLSRQWLDYARTMLNNAVAFEEGMNYARLGQIISIDILPGHLDALVQGRHARAYRWTMPLPRFSHETCEKLITALAGEARLAHGLAEGEVSDELLDVLQSLELDLLPKIGVTCEPPTCTCPTIREAGGSGWCKHGAAVAHLFTERLDAHPAIAWTLRGVDPVELAERTRLKRTIDSGAGPATAHQPLDRSVASAEPLGLDCSIESFYELRPEIATFSTRLTRPEVSHVLVRRLGPSPFPESRFRILGLLSTCYELVSEQVMRETLDRDEAE